MELEIELNKIVAANAVLDTNSKLPFALNNLNVKFKGKAAFKLAVIKSKLKELADTAEKVRQNLIVEKYGVSDENGTYNIPTDEKLEAFMKEYGEVLNVKHTLSFAPLDMEDIEDVELPVEFVDIMLPFFNV
jgi:hypothetical protein